MENPCGHVQSVSTYLRSMTLKKWLVMNQNNVVMDLFLRGHVDSRYVLFSPFFFWVCEVFQGVSL